ncbi:MAG: DNA polymerase ligase N-terminal domain-containing protein [Candidatus Omnitrophota bacterium]
MSLSDYQRKRNFKKTPEPAGIKKTQKKELIFVVQRHKARHLHYDLRLEMQGVLKSWAIPKGPSMNPADRRLAMMVEDHPYDYRTFEGIIPEGNYGAGIVEIWDQGTYIPLTSDKKKPTTENVLVKWIKKGSLKFILQGKKLKGEFALVKIKPRDDHEEDNVWLLIKHNDEFAVHSPYNSEDLTPPSSLITEELKKKKKKEGK